MVPDDIEVPRPAPLSSISDASCVPHPGAGVVARWGDILLVVAAAEAVVISMLLEQCEAVARAGGDGRMLSRRLAGMLSGSDELMPAFAAAAPVETGIAVFVQGSASVAVGDDFTVSGDASLSWVDRLIPWPVTTLTMTTGASSEPVDGPYNLWHGVIPGSGLTLHAVSAAPKPTAPPRMPDVEEPPAVAAGAMPTSATSDDSSAQVAMPTAATSDDSSAQVAMPSSDRWPGQGAEPPTFESVVMDADTAAADEEPPREALPLATQVSHERRESTGPSVRGVYCKNGHFNDPRGLFCAVCGINMVQQTPVLTEGSRPPLGVLLLDDGLAFQLDDDYVLGREPTHDADVSSGRLRGIVLSDEAKSVSRAHARIELRQWDVVLIDNSSANGTYVAAEGESSWTPLPPGTPHVLTSGSRIRLGSRTLAFNSYRGE